MQACTVRVVASLAIASQRAVCCAGPILDLLAAIGLGTAAGLALFGTASIVIGSVLIAVVVVRRPRRAAACATTEQQSRYR
jgi:hypothetical protein